MLILGLAFVAFSRERSEDEFIARIRLESLLRATYLNYGILLLTIVFMYGSAFFMVLVFNMFTILVFFIVHFNLALAKARRNLRTDEEPYQS
jgi:Ca2+-dependent lipid-binding protein